MANQGDCYEVVLKETHLYWGLVRETNSRTPRRNEAYIPIPIKFAREYNIFNSNNSDSGLGYNIFYASSSDGFLNNVELLAQGGGKKGDIYAKNFSGRGNLGIISNWYQSQGAQVGDKLRVYWDSPTHITLTLLPQ